MRLWRLCKTKHADTILSGTGGLHASGRWHDRRTLIICTASTPSLAALETLVHVEPLDAPRAYTLAEIDAPDELGVENVDPNALCRDWQVYPAPAALREFGTRWAIEKRTALLRVPSAVSAVDAESNYLINPIHPAATKITVVRRLAYSFDPRLLAR